MELRRITLLIGIRCESDVQLSDFKEIDGCSLPTTMRVYNTMETRVAGGGVPKAGVVYHWRVRNSKLTAPGGGDGVWASASAWADKVRERQSASSGAPLVRNSRSGGMLPSKKFMQPYRC